MHEDQLHPIPLQHPTEDAHKGDNGDNDPIDSSNLEDHYSPRPKFHHFLRASYPFTPNDAPSPTTVTLPLAAGDIVLVHSIHTNGWADGTLLKSGARGWLPTNYCEPYDYATMRPLLKALTEFWDMIRTGTSDLGMFHNHDYMRGMVAGVRFLLEKSDCLTRDSKLVKDYDTIRRIRKALLADLSLLVKAAKQMHDPVVSLEMDDVLDQVLLKAFQLVTRAVNFFDVWSEEISSTRGLRTKSPTEQIPSVSPEPIHVVESQEDQTHNSKLDVEHDVNKSRTLGSSNRVSTWQPLQTIPENTVQQLKSRPASMTSRPATLTHRLSYTGRPAHYSASLASEKLSTTYDAFLGVLASFLGSHMQSRSSSELLLTTQQAVKACRNLLEVVELIVEHESYILPGLQEAKDAMYDRIADLVHAARSVFRPLHTTDEDLVYLPEEGAQLVHAATACVSGAGRCVAKARLLLEDIGDFEVELQSETPQKLENASSDQTETLSDISEQKPQLDINTEFAVDPTTPTSESWTPLTEAMDGAESTTSSPIAPPIDLENSLPNQEKSLARTTLHGSEVTLRSSMRDSGPSVISQTSTRATTPDINKSSPKTNTDDEDVEDDIMVHQYAHELMLNHEGRIIGGSLNALIERMTAHDGTPDAVFMSTIYLTFRLFATPIEFVEALAFRFDYVAQTPTIAAPVRLRVCNTLKCWLESHWRHDCDEPALPLLEDIARNKILPIIPSTGKRLLESIEIVASTHAPTVSRVLSSGAKPNTSVIAYGDSDQPLPPPILSKSQLNTLKTWRMGGPSVSILDFDALEIARQLTIKESTIFCSILPEELLSTEFLKQSSSLAVNVRAMATLSTDLANLVADSVLQLEEAKRRAQIIKQWIKIAHRCLELNNYDTLMAIVCSINSSTILRLKRTWDLMSQKTKATFEQLKQIVDVSRNYSELRQRLQGHVPPCLPYVGMYRTDLTFVDHGNAASRQLNTGNGSISIINVDKHMKTAKIISDLQRFQIPYRLTEVSELQTWLQDEFIRVRAAGERNFQNQYRRSLILEPRAVQQLQQRSTMGTLASITNGGNFMAWTHMGKDKSPIVGG